TASRWTYSPPEKSHGGAVQGGRVRVSSAAVEPAQPGGKRNGRGHAAAQNSHPERPEREGAESQGSKKASRDSGPGELDSLAGSPVGPARCSCGSLVVVAT